MTNEDLQNFNGVAETPVAQTDADQNPGDNRKLSDQESGLRAVPHRGQERTAPVIGVEHHELTERRRMLRLELEIVGMEKDRFNKMYDEISEQLNRVNLDIMCSDIIDSAGTKRRGRLLRRIELVEG